ncbi:MAG: hypothetical protein LQ342_002830 [Letrouitia transgressa]|nr:MAG: hypothetical protein LQ342_002830 [Letrouitia transgressa]
MEHSHSHAVESNAHPMSMVFTTSTSTPLYSLAWTPNSTGKYAGTCIFLIIFAFIYRALIVGKSILQRRRLEKERTRRVPVRKSASASPPAEPDNPDTKRTKTASDNSGVQRSTFAVKPWRFSVELPRAAYNTLTTGVGYLLMLAVMTLNVGYFLSVLGGTLVGELVFGPYFSPGVKED